MNINPGQRVRIKTAPDRIGVLTDDVQEIAGKKRWLVQFADGPQRIPERNLELVQENESLDDLIHKGNYGRASNLRAAITHARLTGRLADVIYSMESTNTEFYAYQFKPVLNFLDSPSNGILIADEVGLGKTIEAGLIWTELRARMDANRLLIICPAVLREKWAAELLHRFGVRADICNAGELLKKLKDNSKREGKLAVIASIQGIRPPRGWRTEDNSKKSNAAQLARFIDDESTLRELFDCVIIDEAHYLRNQESQTNKLAKLIRPATKYIVLLSATPIQLKSEDLFNLLNIIDGENFEFKRAFDDVLTANRPLMSLASILRSGKCTVEDLVDGLKNCIAHPLLGSSRQLMDLHDNPPKAEVLDEVNYRIRLANRLERVNLLGSIISRTRKRDVQVNRVTREPVAPIIEMNVVEREFYNAVTDGVRRYCQQYGLFEGFLLTIPQRQMCSSMPAAFRAWKRKANLYNDDIVYETTGGGINLDFSSIDIEDNKVGPLNQLLIDIIATVGSYEQLKQADSKYEVLVQLIRNYWKENRNCKIILFSFYRETLHYLHERLQKDGISSAVVMGGVDKEKILSEFRDESGPDILLTTEVLSEGVDLQYSSALINYDLPWNPMRVEQRIGRIDRIGQEKDRILIWNFFYKDTLDDRIYNRLFERLDIFKNSLGDMEAILGEKIRRLTFELLSHDLTPEQEIERIEQTTAAIANEKQNQEYLEDQAAGLAAHGDYVLNRVDAAREMRRYIDGVNLWGYIRDFFVKAYPGCSLVVKSTEPLHVAIDLSMDAKAALNSFIESNKFLNRTSLTNNISGQPITCYFNNNVDHGNKRYEVINQYHPLVRFVACQMKAEEFHPVVAIELLAKNIEIDFLGTYLVIAKRWSTSGAKTIERLVYRGINMSSEELISEIDAEKLITSGVSTGKEWLEVNSVIHADQALNLYHKFEDMLDTEFEEYCQEMKIENEDRVDFLISTLRGQVDRQIASRKEAIEKLKINNNERMIKLNKAQIRKIEENRDKRIIEFNQRRNISTEPRDVILGVINVRE